MANCVSANLLISWPAMRRQPCLASSDCCWHWLCWVPWSTACLSFPQEVPAEATSLSSAVLQVGTSLTSHSLLTQGTVNGSTILECKSWLCATCLAGTVSMTCVSSKYVQQAVPLAVYLAPTLIGSVAFLAVILVAFLYWRRLAGDVANYKQLWHKRRYSAPPLHSGSQDVNLPNPVCCDALPNLPIVMLPLPKLCRVAYCCACLQRR